MLNFEQEMARGPIVRMQQTAEEIIRDTVRGSRSKSDRTISPTHPQVQTEKRSKTREKKIEKETRERGRTEWNKMDRGL